MTQQEIAQGAYNWRKEDEDNRAVIAILVEQGGSDMVIASITGLDMYAYTLSRLFKNSVAARTAAMAALEFIRREEGDEN